MNSNKISGTRKQLKLVDGEIVKLHKVCTERFEPARVVRVEDLPALNSTRFVDVESGDQIGDQLNYARTATVERLSDDEQLVEKGRAVLDSIADALDGATIDSDDDELAELIIEERMRDAAAQAEIIARATGSVAATVTHERRLPSGELVVDAVATFDRKIERVEQLTAAWRAVHSTLSSFEIELLADLPSSGYKMRADGSFETTTRVVVYVDRDNEIAVGVARCAYSFDDTFDVSPFPGAWERVALKQIIRVRHAV